MSQRSEKNGKTPPHDGKGEAPQQDQSETISEQPHGENTKAWQEDKKIGQHNGAGRLPLVNK